MHAAILPLLAQGMIGPHPQSNQVFCRGDDPRIGFSVPIGASMRKGRFSLSWPPDLAHLRFPFGHCQAIRTHRLAGGAL
jgi:hypothetical protein